MSSERLRVHAPVRDARRLEDRGGTLESVLHAERQRAHAAGVDQGRAAAAVELERVAAAIAQERDEALKQLALTSVSLATTIARALLKTEIAAGNYDIESMVRETLAQGKTGRGTCHVHLNPVDCASLAGVPFRTGTVLEADEQVAPGDVHVETSLGLLARETRAALKEIERRLLEELA